MVQFWLWSGSNICSSPLCPFVQPPIEFTYLFRFFYVHNLDRIEIIFASARAFFESVHRRLKIRGYLYS